MLFLQILTNVSLIFCPASILTASILMEVSHVVNVILDFREQEIFKLHHVVSSHTSRCWMNDLLCILVCSDGDARLMDGNISSITAGRVEVCIGNEYGAICSDRWDESDAIVVCRQLGRG